ncbi:MAG: hypothetical protein L3K14_00265 [Thermoplasmata archaeon]|nr:hypothetical protein [Thermoplasmata archaeon]
MPPAGAFRWAQRSQHRTTSVRNRSGTPEILRDDGVVRGPASVDRGSGS